MIFLLFYKIIIKDFRKMNKERLLELEKEMDFLYFNLDYIVWERIDQSLDTKEQRMNDYNEFSWNFAGAEEVFRNPKSGYCLCCEKQFAVKSVKGHIATKKHILNNEIRKKVLDDGYLKYKELVFDWKKKLEEKKRNSFDMDVLMDIMSFRFEGATTSEIKEEAKKLKGLFETLRDFYAECK